MQKLGTWWNGSKKVTLMTRRSPTPELRINKGVTASYIGALTNTTDSVEEITHRFTGDTRRKEGCKHVQDCFLLRFPFRSNPAIEIVTRDEVLEQCKIEPLATPQSQHRLVRVPEKALVKYEYNQTAQIRATGYFLVLRGSVYRLEAEQVETIRISLLEHNLSDLNGELKGDHGSNKELEVLSL